MKLPKTLSAIVLGLGCAIAFIGLLALLLPAVANDQLRLVLASFQTPSHNPVVNLMNSGMSFALQNGLGVLLTGAALALAGGVTFSLLLRREEKEERYSAYRRPVQPAASVWAEPPVAKAQPNPYADLDVWDRRMAETPVKPPVQEPVFSVWNPSPILAPNRLDDEPLWSAPREEPLPEAEPVKQPSAIVRSTCAPAAAQPPQMDDPYADDPRFEPNEEEPPPPPPVSSRIRSTMGKHS